MKKIKNMIDKKIGKHYGYSFTYNKTGLFIRNNGRWWFSPEDHSFVCGVADSLVEWKNGNYLFD